MGEIVKILSVIGISSVKFIGGPILGYAYNYTFFQTILFTVLGGMCGVICISYFSKFVFKAWKWVKLQRAEWILRKKRKEIFSSPTVDADNVHISYSYVSNEKKKLIFTSRNRKIVKYWKKFGLMGIALFTPVFISIPIGTMIATKYVPNRKKVMLYMFCSLVFWAFVVTSIFELFSTSI